MNAELLELAVEAARHAGDLLLERFGEPARGVDTKSTATDPVSDADRDAEALILGIVQEARPDDGVLAEEGSDRPSRTGLRWVIDPLDGTVNFLFGIPQWAVSVAVEDADGPVAGVVHDPCRDETFTAAHGTGAHLNGTRLDASSVTDLSKALIGTGFSYDPGVRRAQVDVLHRVIGRVRDVRRAGSAALDLAWTACGRLDGFYEAGLGPWDMSAGSLLVTESGGRTGPLPAPIEGRDGLIAAGPGIYDDLVGVLDAAIA